MRNSLAHYFSYNVTQEFTCFLAEMYACPLSDCSFLRFIYADYSSSECGLVSEHLLRGSRPISSSNQWQIRRTILWPLYKERFQHACHEQLVPFLIGWGVLYRSRCELQRLISPPSGFTISKLDWVIVRPELSTRSCRLSSGHVSLEVIFRVNNRPSSFPDRDITASRSEKPPTYFYRSLQANIRWSYAYVTVFPSHVFWDESFLKRRGHWNHVFPIVSARFSPVFWRVSEPDHIWERRFTPLPSVFQTQKLIRVVNSLVVGSLSTGLLMWFVHL